jgi:2-dehydro-3-deoxyphosphogluconate aldolase/(4S)-4-hydroxy-2-oxoglutarate aldolase
MSAADELRDALRVDGVMAILRYRDGGDLAAAVEGLCAGGVRVLEITVDTPGGWEAIAAAAAVPGRLIGAGTVTTADQVRRLAGLGGRFVVSPGLDADVVTAAREHGLATFPGVVTGTEVLAARRLGVDFLKLFPAGALGPRYLSELRGPFADVDFVPTGGIGLDEVRAWLAAGALAVALGSSLAGRAAPASIAEVDALTARAAAALLPPRTETDTAS